MKITAKELSVAVDMDYGTANGLLRYMVSKGMATVCEKRKPVNSTGRGKPTNVYEVGEQFVLNFPIVPACPAMVKEALEAAVAGKGSTITEMLVEEGVVSISE